MIIKRESRKNHCLSWLLEHSELLVCGAVISPHEMAKNACGCWSESASGCVWVDDWTVWQWPGIWCLWGDVICVWILLNWCLHKLMFSTKQQPSSYQGALFSIYFCPQLLSQPLTHVWVGLSLWTLFQLHSLHHRRAEVSGENSSMKLK